MKNRGKPFSETEIRNWCFQIFQALNHMHQRGYFHRDLKPGMPLAFSFENNPLYDIVINLSGIVKSDMYVVLLG
jgi:serine/threonine protein kinase